MCCMPSRPPAPGRSRPCPTNTARLTQRYCSSPVPSRQVEWIAWCVTAGDPIAVVEAMKMEAAITVPGGTVSRTAIDRIAPVEGGDLLLVVDVDNAAKCAQPADRSAEIVGVGS